MPLSADIQALVSKFSGDVEALIRSAALAAVTDALGGTVPSQAPKPASKPASKPAARAVRPARTVRARRSPEQLEATAARIVDYVRQHPASKAEQIKAALKIKGNEWGGPLRLALESKRIAVRGERRAAAYSVPGGAVPPIKRVAK